MDLSYSLNIFNVIISFAAAIMMYLAYNRFTGGDFKRFLVCVVFTAFVFLFVQIFWLYTLRPNYAGISRETIKALNTVLSMAIGISFIILALRLDAFSKKFGFLGKKR